MENQDRANTPLNARYIGYKCVPCGKTLSEHERQTIISLGAVQTWCLLCMAIKYPKDKCLHDYVASNGKHGAVLDRNKLINGL